MITKNQDSFLVIGIEARTNNKKEAGPDGVIPKFWDQFMKENLVAKIPHKADDAIIAAYTEYESDMNGDYTFFIGAKVSEVNIVPEGMVYKKVEAGNYKVATTEKGPVWEVVLKAWQNIWSLPASDANRNYLFDYEVYDQRVQDPSNGMVDIFIGVK
jgi:predicted transcriptional regulator YdeE